MHSQEIPLVVLDTNLAAQHRTQAILENEIRDIHVEQVAISENNRVTDNFDEGFRTIYLFLKGTGFVLHGDSKTEISPESIFLPNITDKIAIQSANDEALLYLKINCKLSKQDLEDLQELPIENTQNIYYAEFKDCQPYTEAIKSPNTVSRTILSNKYIPRIAMGTVRTTGPDKVAAHRHPMLEQLFLGLSENDCTVYADANKVNFPQFSVLHIPLGSNHSVSVDENKLMYYVWMDFFLDKKGEDWLQTHKVSTNG